MKSAIPKYHETYNPILDLLRDGQIIPHRELLAEVVKKYYSDLP